MTTRKPAKKPKSPPSATGDAGGDFQAKIAAHYLLTVLAEATPRGLAGAKAVRVKHQQAAKGHPFDDVVVEALDADGSPATIEIQAKRTMTFTKSDKEFADIVNRAWLISQKPEFGGQRYEMAVAIARTSTRIEQSCQEVLAWARQQTTGADFRHHLDLFASDQKQDFIDAFRTHLRSADRPDDDETLWRLLNRFQILVFNFETPGSTCDSAAVERARVVLASDQAGRASDLWLALVNEAHTLHATGGTVDRAALIRRLKQNGGFRFGASQDLHAVLGKLNETTELTLADIFDDINGIRLARSEMLDQCFRALGSSKIVEIVGEPGCGKSALLKRLASNVTTEGAAIVLARGRVIAGGWPQLRSQLACPVGLSELMNELASGGGATLFIDNVDQIDDEREKLTLRDLMRAAVRNPAWRIVVTTSLSGPEWHSDLAGERETLSIATVSVPSIGDREANVLASERPALTLLLDPKHGARSVARNLFYLSRLANRAEELGSEIRKLVSEVDMARLWWALGGGRSQTELVQRLRALRTLAARIIERPNSATYRVDDLEPSAIEEMVRADTLRHGVLGSSVGFRHDVIRDWAVAFFVHEDATRTASLSLHESIPSALFRGLELAARLALEQNDSGKQWLELLSTLEGPGAHGSWRRPVLLALPRSESAHAHLAQAKAILLAQEGQRLAEVIRLLSSIESTPLADILPQGHGGAANSKAVESLALPRNLLAWMQLVSWLVKVADELPTNLIPDVAHAFRQWLLVARETFFAPLNAAIVKCLYGWLCELERALNSIGRHKGGRAEGRPLRIENLRETRENIRFTFLAFCDLQPELARDYLNELREANVRYFEIQSVLKMPGASVRAAPAALTDLVLSAFIPEDDPEDSYQHHSDRHAPFDLPDVLLHPAFPGQGPFLALLNASPSEGLRLIRGLTEHATAWRFAKARSGGPTISIPFPDGARTYRGDTVVFLWPREARGSTVVESALMALEAWAHQRIESRQPFGDVLNDVIGPSGGSVAFLCVAADLTLSHWDLAKNHAWPLLASPDLLWYDDWRFKCDAANAGRNHPYPEESQQSVKSIDLKVRPSRGARLLQCLCNIAFNGPPDVRTLLLENLRGECERVRAAATDNVKDSSDSLPFIARLASRLVDPSNWKREQTQSDGQEVSRAQYIPHPEETATWNAERENAQAAALETSMRIRLEKTLLDPAASSPELLDEAIGWARRGARKFEDEEDAEFDQSWHERAVVMAAAIVARDYAKSDRTEIEVWSRDILSRAALEPVDSVSRYTPHVSMHRAAIATLGLVVLYRRRPESALLEGLFRAASRCEEPVATVIREAFGDISRIDERLPRSFVRIVMRSAIRPRRRYDLSEEWEGIAEATWRNGIEEAIQAELGWLGGTVPEPTWPKLPPWPSRPKMGIRIPGGIEDVAPSRKAKHRLQESGQYVIDQAISDILKGLSAVAADDPPQWAMELISDLLGWTIEANNGPSDESEGTDRENRPNEWNTAFFGLIGSLSSSLPFHQVEELFLKPISRLDDEAFLDAVVAFLLPYDVRILSGSGPQRSRPDLVRRHFAERIRAGHRWRYMAYYGKKEFTTEWHLGHALKAMFFYPPYSGQMEAPYIPDNHEALRAVMPTLTDLAASAPKSGYIAFLLVGLLRRSPTASAVADVGKVVSAWANTVGVDRDFWADRGIGTNVCAWLEAVISEENRAQASAHFARALDVMIQSGLPQAQALEIRLNQEPR